MRRFLGYIAGAGYMVVFSLQEVYMVLDTYFYVCIFQYKGKHVLYHMVTSRITEHSTLEADQKEGSTKGEL